MASHCVLFTSRFDVECQSTFSVSTWAAVLFSTPVGNCSGGNSFPLSLYNWVNIILRLGPMALFSNKEVFNSDLLISLITCNLTLGVSCSWGVVAVSCWKANKLLLRAIHSTSEWFPFLEFRSLAVSSEIDLFIKEKSTSWINEKAAVKMKNLFRFESSIPGCKCWCPKGSMSYSNPHLRIILENTRHIVASVLTKHCLKKGKLAYDQEKVWVWVVTRVSDAVKMFI